VCCVPHSHAAAVAASVVVRAVGCVRRSGATTAAAAAAGRVAGVPEALRHSACRQAGRVSLYAHRGGHAHPPAHVQRWPRVPHVGRGAPVR
jgi:hypothetical protein